MRSRSSRCAVELLGCVKQLHSKRKRRSTGELYVCGSATRVLSLDSDIGCVRYLDSGELQMEPLHVAGTTACVQLFGRHLLSVQWNSLAEFIGRAVNEVYLTDPKAAAGCGC